MELGILSVSAITVICYLIGEAIKASPLADKWIPIIVGLCGGGIGVIGMYVMPDFPAGDPMQLQSELYLDWQLLVSTRLESS